MIESYNNYGRCNGISEKYVFSYLSKNKLGNVI